MSNIRRRDFCASVAALSFAAGAPAQSDPAPDIAQSKTGFPVSDFTPFGYLDNPWHTWDLHRNGILRSVNGIGFGLYYPAGPGGYFDYKHDGVYELFLTLGFLVEGRQFRAREDFQPGQLFSPHHSKNLFAYEFSAEGLRTVGTFLQVDENAIAARIQLAEQSGRKRSLRILAAHTYRLGGASWWGRDGLTGNFDANADSLLMRSFAAGPCCAITSSHPSAAHFVSASDDELVGWLTSATGASQATTYYPHALHGALRYDLDLSSNSRVEIVIVMARGSNGEATLAHAKASLKEASGQIVRKELEDAAFWNSAPQLAGDWPKHWKHGWVYDFETLRMMVRRPIGLYKHAWDPMQIQAPRNVLAETSIDMWALSYADPASAQSVFAGQFLDAVKPNVPCMREDGVMNMVAADGSECGTSISWCFPFFCAESIFNRTQDLLWLRQIYPGLTRLLRWTLAHRADSAGFVIGKCSWETGMDASKRFLIEQPTGGELTEFMRLPELQAAAAHAGGALAYFARQLGDTATISEWEQIQKTYKAKTQQLWRDDWFHDFDAHTNQFATATARDPAQSAPAFCGIATDDQKRRMLPTLRQIFENSRARQTQAANTWEDGLAWSSLVLPYIESIWAAGDNVLASEVVTTIADRIYSSMDRRSVSSDHGSSKSPDLGWPGVSCEVWGPRGAFGGEGYGWGAVMPAHLIRNLVGFRETDLPETVWICPNLPSSLAEPGKRYSIAGLLYGRERLNLQYHFVDPQRIRINGQWSGSTQVVSGETINGAPMSISRTGKEWQFEGVNHTRYRLQLRTT